MTFKDDSSVEWNIDMYIKAKNGGVSPHNSNTQIGNDHIKGTFDASLILNQMLESIEKSPNQKPLQEEHIKLPEPIVVVDIPVEDLNDIKDGTVQQIHEHILDCECGSVSFLISTEGDIYCADCYREVIFEEDSDDED
jgi:hypothetical protein